MAVIHIAGNAHFFKSIITLPNKCARSQNLASSLPCNAWKLMISCIMVSKMNCESPSMESKYSHAVSLSLPIPLISLAAFCGDMHKNVIKSHLVYLALVACLKSALKIVYSLMSPVRCSPSSTQKFRKTLSPVFITLFGGDRICCKL